MSDASEALAVINNRSRDEKAALLALRNLILDVAESNKDIGEIIETVKWGQPAFLTRLPKTGTTVRIDCDPSGNGGVALFVSCQSSLVSEWRGLFPHLTYSGDRGVHFPMGRELPRDELRQMVTMALTYHRRKRRRSSIKA